MFEPVYIIGIDQRAAGILCKNADRTGRRWKLEFNVRKKGQSLGAS